MDPDKIRALLEGVKAGERSVDQALTELADLPYRYNCSSLAHIDVGAV